MNIKILDFRFKTAEIRSFDSEIIHFKWIDGDDKQVGTYCHYLSGRDFAITV